MSLSLSAYRLLTGAMGAVLAPAGLSLARAHTPWRERWGGVADAERAAGGPWIHAASMGETVAARCWADALASARYRTPFLVTTRTRTGLERVRREWGDRAVASLAPLDFPQAVRRVFHAAAPMRLDVMETELWPNLLFEAHRARVPAVIVSGTVSARTARRLKAWGLAGPELFGPLHVLAQSEEHATRFQALGVSPERCAVIGDVKGDALPRAGDDAAGPVSSRRLVVFASARPGEEDAVVATATAVASRKEDPPWRLIVAPRHADAVERFRGALASAGFGVAVRNEANRSDRSARVWASDSDTAAGSRPVGILATTGELAELFPLARLALVGGTFAPWGGHNVLEPAAYGCPVLVGPYHGDVEAGVALLVRHGGGAVVHDASTVGETVGTWLEGDGDDRAAGARAAADAARGASRRGLDVLSSWDIAL